MLFFHEPWRDEMQAFSIANTSNSLAELINATRYEGHPSLWFIILFFITRFTSSILLIQLIHLAIMSTGVFVFLKYAPIKMIQKIIIIFGYYFIYEYSLLFRCYAIGISLLFIACVLIERKKIILSGILLFFVFQSNVYSLFLGTSIWMICFFSFYKVSAWKTILASIIVVAGILLFFFTVLPLQDAGYAAGYQLKFLPILSNAINIWKSFIVIPKLDVHFWNSSILDSLSETNALLIMRIGSGFIAFFCLFYLRKSNKAVIFFLISTITIILFSAIKFDGYLRHNGHIFISFIIALWIKEIFPNKTSEITAFDKTKGIIAQLYHKINKDYLLNTLLLMHVFSGLLAYSYEYRYSFSKAKEVASYLKENKMTDFQIIGHSDFSISTIAAMLNKKIYYPTSKDYFTHIVWNNKRNENVTDEDLMHLIIQIAESKTPVLLITSYEITNKNLLNSYNIKLLKAFKPAIVDSEEFYLYN
ncbi:MAG: hypothetical protein WCO13_09535 [Bacteroidota bacterium]